MAELVMLSVDDVTLIADSTMSMSDIVELDIAEFDKNRFKSEFCWMNLDEFLNVEGCRDKLKQYVWSRTKIILARA